MGYARGLLLRGAGLPLIEASTRTRFWTLYRRMLSLDASSRAALLGEQTICLAALLRAAGAQVPFWREQFATAGLNPHEVSPDTALASLARLRVTDKKAMSAGFPARVTAEGPRDDWRYTSSAGTTDRLTVVKDFDKRDRDRAAELRAFHIATGEGVGVSCVEIPPNACNVVCGLTDDGPQGVVPFLWRAIRRGMVRQPETLIDLRGRIDRQYILRRTTLHPIEPEPRDRLDRALDDRLETILRVRPQTVRGLPTYLVWLADRARQRGLRFRGLKAVLPYGGLLSSAMRQRVEAGFGVPFRDIYGTGELGVIAASCGNPGAHVFEDLFVVEVLRDGAPVPVGQIGQVVITDLSNTAMPLIRYAVGDVGYFIEEKCACGRAGRRLVVCGRTQDMLPGPTGEPVTATALLDLFFAHPEVSNFRIDEISPGRYAVSVVPTTVNPPLARLSNEFQALLGIDRPPRVKATSLIRPESSGKYRAAFRAPGAS